MIDNQAQETATEALGQLLAYATELGVIIDVPETFPGTGSISYHFHDEDGCHLDSRTDGFASISAALIAGLAAYHERLTQSALQPYFQVMDALEDAGVQISPSPEACFQYTLPTGCSAAGFASEGAALCAALRHMMNHTARTASGMARSRVLAA